MQWFIMTVLFYCVSCDDTVSVEKPVPKHLSIKIVGGQPTTIETHPYMVQILLNHSPRCGGVLLTRGHVLTAAHCFYDEHGLVTASKLSVRAGSTYSTRGGTVYKVSTFVNFDAYYIGGSSYDVSVVVLSSTISNYNSSTVQIASIPPAGYAVPDNASVISVGWGLTDPHCNASTSIIMRHVGVRTVNRHTCNSQYSYLRAYEYITENMICAGLLGVGGKDSCGGDSGGPLVYGGVVVGITSFGIGCGNESYPGVYTRVSSFTSWISSTVQKHPVRSHMRDGATADVDHSLRMLLLLGFSLLLILR